MKTHPTTKPRIMSQRGSAASRAPFVPAQMMPMIAMIRSATRPTTAVISTIFIQTKMTERKFFERIYNKDLTYF